ncbi:hypothetical protein ARMGADRAFT_1017156 [Armillaria gallica]|uniref:Uncharacterized protein n=1 Tax=Armillaria gallica TaxID=47427 RepID=A0A2H3CZ86_ARMGA|nr:hypothetical protein ARMGADRAFT_1017156 [Armillaria gallica]
MSRGLLALGKRVKTRKEITSLLSVTLPSTTGTGQRLSNPVRKQRCYTGRKPVIPSALADTLRRPRHSETWKSSTPWFTYVGIPSSVTSSRRNMTSALHTPISARFGTTT